MSDRQSAPAERYHAAHRWLLLLFLAITSVAATACGQCKPAGSPATDATPPSLTDAGADATSSDPPPPAPTRETFLALATTTAHEHKFLLTSLAESDLDRDGEIERIALLCSNLGDRPTGAFLIEDDRDHHWLITFGELDGRSSLDSLGNRGCWIDEPSPAVTPWTQPQGPWIRLQQGHHGGGATCRVALRYKRPVLVWTSRVDDTRESDKEVITDHDAQHAENGTPYPDLDTGAEKHCDMPAHVETI